MKPIFLTLALLFIIITAQSQSGKIESTIYKADKKMEQVDQLQKAGSKLKGLFGGKKDKESKAAKDSAAVPKTVDGTGVAANNMAGKTVISITGIDYPKLKTLNENIRNCKGVQSSKMAFDVVASQIEVAHSGSTEDLMKLVSETSRDIFTDKNITGLSDGKVILRL